MNESFWRVWDRLRGNSQSRVDARHQGRALLRQMLADRSAEFRPDQWDAIERIVYRHQRLLVVQRTGWGKSLVYFLATCLLRDEGYGPTLLISPLLALMRNQVLAANRLGVRAATINSTNTDMWPSIQSDLRRNRIDLLLISPERLASTKFIRDVLLPMADDIGLLVVDEAHCISDWGHDFRPDYRRIPQILELLPQKLPILATTATANARVVDDITSLLGPRMHVTRGPLTRETLYLQNIPLQSPAERMAWLADHVPQLPGSGIIYTLTIREAQRVAAWLQTRDIDARAYWGRLETHERVRLEERLLANEIKALVATFALGMGFDKPDLGFVIHYQRPSSAVHYYQQIGRAGRAIDPAYGILLGGEEDDEVIKYFIRSAFPPKSDINKILEVLDGAAGGQTLSQLEQRLNLSHEQIDKTLRILDVQSPPLVARQGWKWYREEGGAAPDRTRWNELTQLREYEQSRMQRFMGTGDCLMRFLLEELDDETATPCGRCANCQGHDLLPVAIHSEVVDRAVRFLRENDQELLPHTRWPNGALANQGWEGVIPPNLRHQQGRALAIWGDEGWGELVRMGKQVTGRFDDALVTAAARMIRYRWRPDPFPTWVTCVPSLAHPEIVPNYTQRLAGLLKLPFHPVVQKSRYTAPQKEMENAYQQAHNLEDAFHVLSPPGVSGPVLLVDDVADSGWTFAVVAALLREAGSGHVYPMALAVARSLGAT